MTDLADAPIRVSAVVVRDAAGRIVTVRKGGTQRFQLPGGKPDPGESPIDTAVRECAEEIGVELDPDRLHLLGTFRAPAANEAGRDVEGVVYTSPDTNAAAGATASGEIAEIRLLDPAARPLPDDLAHLLRDHVLPALTAAN